MKTKLDYKKEFIAKIERKYFSSVKVVEEEKPLTKLELKKINKKARNKYYNSVKIITKAVDRASIKGYDENRLLTQAMIQEIGFHITATSELLVIDHKISLDYGFKNNIPAEVIAHVSNLHFIPACENKEKGTKCLFDDDNIWIEKQYISS